MVGRLPTTTQPPGSIASAVVRPTPPGHAPGSGPWIWAKVLTDPHGETCTMVVPVPCELAALLKLLTRVSPATSLPVDWGTTVMP